LQRFTRDGVQSAFTDLVRRHLDLVFATAMRKLEDTGAAQEVAQNVFAALARKAWRFAPDDSLPAWLHKAALLESKSWLRGELGRRRREEAAAELGTTMKSSDDLTAFHALVPLLDEALLSLREKDRVALLLRYYEKQSLRDVGAAFGVSEDTAQKRVQGALEKVTAYFKRRGYRTATVAATIAALKHTAVSTSATVLGAVVSTVVKSAPPALAGLSALLARLASLTKVQTAAVCLLMAAAPTWWQWKEHRVVKEEVQRMRLQLLAAQTDSANTQADLDQLRTDVTGLDRSLAQANEAAARAAESAQAFAAWKQKLRSSLLAADYRWSDESAFVRIPKAILPELSDSVKVAAVSPPGVVNPLAGELLCLTPAERQAMEEILQRVAELQRGEKLDAYEINKPAVGRVVAAKLFTPEPPGKTGPEAEQRFTQMLADIRGILGEERFPVLPSRVRNVNVEILNGMLMPQPIATIEATVETDENGIPQVKWTIVGDATTPAQRAKAASASAPGTNAPKGNVYSLNTVGSENGNAALSAFLPDGDPDQRRKATNATAVHIPSAVKQRMAAWFQEQAALRMGEKDKP